jgi:hypothetical protein
MNARRLAESPRAYCATCSSGRDHCDGFVFDVRLADGSVLEDVELIDGTAGAASSVNSGTRDPDAAAASLLERIRAMAVGRGSVRIRHEAAIEVAINGAPVACRPVMWPRSLCQCSRRAGEPRMMVRTEHDHANGGVRWSLLRDGVVIARGTAASPAEGRAAAGRAAGTP